MAPSRTVTSHTPGGTRNVPRKVRERQMLEAAERAFAERGFHAASVDAIAEASGITKPMVYAYFGSKEGLYRACMERARAAAAGGAARRRGHERARPTSSSGTACSRSSRSSNASTTRGRSCSARSPRAPARSPPRAPRSGASSPSWSPSCCAARPPPKASHTDALGITDQLAHALMGAGESLAVWWEEHPEQPVEQVALVLMNFAWNGLGGLVEGRTWSPR